MGDSLGESKATQFLHAGFKADTLAAMQKLTNNLPRPPAREDFRSLDATLPKNFFSALVERIAATVLHALEQRLH